MLRDLWKTFIQKEKINEILEKRTGDCTKYNSQNYLEKLRYVCTDFDMLYSKNVNNITMQEVICAVVYMDWTIESVDMIEKELSYVLSTSFITSNKYDKLKEYSNSLRSFIIAHPLETNRHSKYKLDGSYICVDIQPQASIFIIGPESYKYFSLSGLQNKPNKNKRYVYIKCYSANKIKENRKSHTISFDNIAHPNELYFFGIALEDIYEVISYCIKRLDYFNRTIKKII